MRCFCLFWSLQSRKHLETKLNNLGVEGFAEVVCARSRLEGYQFLLHAKGLGPLRPNTVLMHWPNDLWRLPEHEVHNFCSLITDTKAAKKTLLM